MAGRNYRGGHESHLIHEVRAIVLIGAYAGIGRNCVLEYAIDNPNLLTLLCLITLINTNAIDPKQDGHVAV
jgi:hypothetical protein